MPETIESLDTVELLCEEKLKIVQKKTGYRFSIDAFLLANFVTLKKGERLLDIGTGCGIIPIYMAKRGYTNSMLGVEIQDDLFNLALENRRINNVGDQIDFLKGDITPSYAYLIPKNGLFVIGTGAPMRYPVSIHRCLGRFKEWLGQEFAFEPLSLERKEIGIIPIIPHCSSFSGKGNVILAGDAAGFCNSFSGEGIRLAIESGIAASEAITQAEQSGGRLSSLYAQQVKGLSEFIRKTNRFSIALTDKEREKFVASQVKRPSFRHSA